MVSRAKVAEWEHKIGTRGFRVCSSILWISDIVKSTANERFFFFEFVARIVLGIFFDSLIFFDLRHSLIFFDNYGAVF